MPNLHGFDLARLIRKSSWNKSTPIIIVTGRDQRDTLQQAFSIGATFCLQKPVDRNKLKTLFRTVLSGMLENRRRHARSPIQTEVMCTVDSRTIRGLTWNLSQGGMQVEAGGLAGTIFQTEGYKHYWPASAAPLFSVGCLSCVDFGVFRSSRLCSRRSSSSARARALIGFER
jgi:DNA-binding response OmpR family regulator